MPPRKPITVYGLLRHLLIHALRGHGSHRVELLVSKTVDSAGHRLVLRAEASDIAWETDRNGSYTLIGYENRTSTT